MFTKQIIFVAAIALVGAEPRYSNYATVCQSGCTKWFDGCNRCECNEIDPSSSFGLCPSSLEGIDDPVNGICNSRKSNGRISGKRWRKPRCQKFQFFECDRNFANFSTKKQKWCCYWTNNCPVDKAPPGEVPDEPSLGVGTTQTEMCHRQRCNAGFECNRNCASPVKKAWCISKNLDCNE
mmetsp:Transcript_2795/g.5812  ORF Transcript_2795/g.5812 Transcript_2795/m.5812 type:complete len:180 (-) Transcript_2795:253-792(-)